MDKKVILISIDGLRPDAVETNNAFSGGRTAAWTYTA